MNRTTKATKHSPGPGGDLTSTNKGLQQSKQGHKGTKAQSNNKGLHKGNTTKQHTTEPKANTKQVKSKSQQRKYKTIPYPSRLIQLHNNNMQSLVSAWDTVTIAITTEPMQHNRTTHKPRLPHLTEYTTAKKEMMKRKEEKSRGGSPTLKRIKLKQKP